MRDTRHPPKYIISPHIFYMVQSNFKSMGDTNNRAQLILKIAA